MTARYESLDMWRGVACLLVLLNHAVFYRASGADPGVVGTIYTGMSAVAARLWIGVPVFFVISGYCIAASADAHRRKGAPVGTFFLKRFRRIFPPYWVVLIAAAVLIGGLDLLAGGGLSQRGGLYRPWWFSGWQWLGSITLTETWRYHLIGGPKGLFLGHAWTLCYEEQFYAICGLLLALWPRRFFEGAAIVTALCAMTALAAPAAGISIDGFFFDGGWVQFAFGVAVYHAWAHGATMWRRVLALLLVAVAAACLSMPAALAAVDKNDVQALFIAALFAVTALWLKPFDQRLVGHPRLQPLRQCGVMCYSLYLVHLPVVNLIRASLAAAGIDTGTLSPLLTIAVCGGASLWVAWQFHLLVERRFLSSPQVPIRITAPPHAVAVP